MAAVFVRCSKVWHTLLIKVCLSNDSFEIKYYSIVKKKLGSTFSPDSALGTASASFSSESRELERDEESDDEDE